MFWSPYTKFFKMLTLQSITPMWEVGDLGQKCEIWEIREWKIGGGGKHVGYV